MQDSASEKNGCRWLVLVLKDRYSNDESRRLLAESLEGKYGLAEGDVRFIPCADSPVYANFVFVRTCKPFDDLRNIVEYKHDMLESFRMHMRITDEEFNALVGGIGVARRQERVKHGDVVRIRNGAYCKLHGIVLREDRYGRIEVGMKFCFGTVVRKYNESDLEVVGNLFRYLKVLK